MHRAQMRKGKIAGIILFCLILFGTSLVSGLRPDRKYSVAENRELHQKPKLSGKTLLNGKYQKRYENYVSDQFFFRDEWVSLAARIQQALGKSEINGVYLGKDGYLLEKYDETEVSSEQIIENVEILSSFLNHAMHIYGNGHVSCLLVPSKTEVLENKLPGFAPQVDVSSVRDSLRERLEEQELLIDAGETLQAHENEYIYYRTDHHWTTLGAFYAYQAWCRAMGYTVLDAGHYERETVFTDFYGTTYHKLPVCVPADHVELFHNPLEQNIRVEFDGGEKTSDTLYFREEAAEGVDRYRIFFSKNTFQIVVDTGADTGRTLLLVKDSFANCFVPFLSENFDRIIMIDNRYGKESIGTVLGEYGMVTDVLVLLNTEKFMQNGNMKFLTDMDIKNQTMEEFDMEDFFG